MSSTVSAIIFDCFGVIIDDALSAMTKQLETTDPESVERIRALLYRANTGQIEAEESSAEIAEIFGLTYADYRKKLQQYEVKDQVLLDYILGLRSTYKTALLSNIPNRSLLRRFTTEELDKYFDTAVASGEVGYAKPEARAYEITADRLDVRLDECVFIDDREGYCEGARAVGMQTILYKNFAQFRTELEAILAQ